MRKVNQFRGLFKAPKLRDWERKSDGALAAQRERERERARTSEKREVDGVGPSSYSA